MSKDVVTAYSRFGSSGFNAALVAFTMIGLAIPAFAQNPNCTLILPENPLSATGLATPFQLAKTPGPIEPGPLLEIKGLNNRNQTATGIQGGYVDPSGIAHLTTFSDISPGQIKAILMTVPSTYAVVAPIVVADQGSLAGIAFDAVKLSTTGAANVPTIKWYDGRGFFVATTLQESEWDGLGRQRTVDTGRWHQRGALQSC